MVQHKKVVLPVIGYEHLLSRIALRMPPLEWLAQVRPAKRNERIEALVEDCFSRDDNAVNRRGPPCH